MFPFFVFYFLCFFFNNDTLYFGELVNYYVFFLFLNRFLDLSGKHHYTARTWFAFVFASQEWLLSLGIMSRGAQDVVAEHGVDGEKRGGVLVVMFV